MLQWSLQPFLDIVKQLQYEDVYSPTYAVLAYAYPLAMGTTMLLRLGLTALPQLPATFGEQEGMGGKLKKGKEDRRRKGKKRGGENGRGKWREGKRRREMRGAGGRNRVGVGLQRGTDAPATT